LTDCMADPQGSACKTCYTDKCLPAFYTCSGFSAPTTLKADAKDMCLDAQDQKVYNDAYSGDIKKSILECWAENTGAGVESCMKKDGLTAGCATCFGTYANCANTKCSSECYEGSVPFVHDAGNACVSCTNSKCMPAFNICSGLKEFQLSAPEADTGKCTDSTDMTKATDLETDLVSCFETESTSEDIETCMEGKGFTAPCAGCMGTYATCVYDNCASDCANPKSSECETCYTQKCLPAFYTCTGFQPETLFLDESQKRVQRLAKLTKAE